MLSFPTLLFQVYNTVYEGNEVAPSYAIFFLYIMWINVTNLYERIRRGD